MTTCGRHLLQTAQDQSELGVRGPERRRAASERPRLARELPCSTISATSMTKPACLPNFDRVTHVGPKDVTYVAGMICNPPCPEWTQRRTGVRHLRPLGRRATQDRVLQVKSDAGTAQLSTASDRSSTAIEGDLLIRGEANRRHRAPVWRQGRCRPSAKPAARLPAPRWSVAMTPTRLAPGHIRHRISQQSVVKVWRCIAS